MGFDDMFISNYWKLCDELTIRQAALLIIGIDPASETGVFCEGWEPKKRPSGYDAAKQALIVALRRNGVVGQCQEVGYTDMNGNPAGIGGTRRSHARAMHTRWQRALAITAFGSSGMAA